MSEEIADVVDSLDQLSDDSEELASDKVADLVEYIVCGLVTNEDAVSLDVTDSEGAALIEVSCA